MKTPLTLTILSAGLALLSGLWSGGVSGLVLIWLCAGLAALVLTLRSWLAAPDSPPHKTGRRAGRKPAPGHSLVVDGSNLLYWRGEAPDIRSVGKILGLLMAQGHSPKVWFDANVGYLVSGRFMPGAELAKMLKIDPSSVVVAPRGQPADPLILAASLRDDLPVLSNDRFRDWHEAYPHITRPGTLLHGQLQKDHLLLTPAVKPAKPEPAPRATGLPPVPGERRRPAAAPQRPSPPHRKEPRF